MTQEIDYATVLADLEAKKLALEAAIAGIKQLIGQTSPDTVNPIPMGGSSEHVGTAEIGPGTFHGMSVPEAAKAFLQMVKRKQKTKTICDAALAGGIETNAKNFYSNMYSALQRDKDFVRLGKYWALAAWYPSRSTMSPSKPRKRTKRKKSKPAKAKESSRTEMASSELKVAG